MCYRSVTTALTAQIPAETLSQSHRLCFIGKERDSETGFSYFGARYYDSDILTGWLSVDPMADKYPNISPYAYCAWNPIKLLDPDGNAIILTNTLKSNSSISFILSVASKNSVFRNVMQNFYSDKSNVYIHLGQLLTDGIPSGKGNLARAERAASPDNPVGKYGIGRIVINSDILDKSGNFSGDQTFIFAALLHEGIHAKMHDIYRIDPTFSNYPGYKDFILNRSKDGGHHNQMAAFNRQTLIDGMKEFDNQMGTSHSDEWYEAISWTGLQNTKAWKDFYKMNPDLGNKYKKIQIQEANKLGGE